MYCIAQNFGGVNFWWLVARHAIGGEKFGESSTTGSQVHAQVSHLKLWRGKFWLAYLDKSAKIFHHQNFVLYGNLFCFTVASYMQLLHMHEA